VSVQEIYIYIYSECSGSHRRSVVLSRQRIIHYFIEKGFKINRDRILAHKRIISAAVR
jgi:hypothetical protein